MTQLFAISLFTALALPLGVDPRPDPEAIELHIPVQGEEAWLVRRPDGSLTFQLRGSEGPPQALTPDQFALAAYTSEARRPWWQRLLNISSAVGIAWVALGLLGQLLFTGRMLLQWLVSERERRSVVPPVFWWLSLGGAVMLLTYFIWRKDIVGVLGQATGGLVYARNLWLIHRTPVLEHAPG
jgi:lipid-A-disaccharide synthase-like uncharacterized protein